MLKTDKVADVKSAGPAGNWKGSWLRRPLYTARPPQTEHAGMSLSLEIQLEQGPAWLTARGTSMLRLPGSQVKIERLATAPVMGMVLVFRHGATLTYHRVIERINSDQWRTKGDTLLEPDELVSKDEMIGEVTAVRWAGWQTQIRPDASLAWLSQRLGVFFAHRGRATGGLRRIFYLTCLIGAWPLRRLLAKHHLAAAQSAAPPAVFPSDGGRGRKE